MTLFLVLGMPYLIGAIALISLVHEPFAPPVPNGAVAAERVSEGDPCGDDPECWSGFYTGVIDLKGSGAALKDLKARTLAGEPVRDYCHELLHDIGMGAYAETGSVSRAYAGGDPFCRAGYYHGILEGAFGDDGMQLLARLDELCAQVPGKSDYSYQYFSCVHGIGHGLMAYFNQDLFRSLDACAELTGEWEIGSCAGGVFMQNAMNDSGEFSEDDPFYPCSAVGERFDDACYLMQTSRILATNSGDFGATFALCRTLESAHRTTCFESLGRDASGWARGDVAAASSYCVLGGDTYERDHCTIGAAIDLIQSRGAEEARALCARAEGSALCLERVHAHLEHE
jgi:hypothetical protein